MRQGLAVGLVALSLFAGAATAAGDDSKSGSSPKKFFHRGDSAGNYQKLSDAVKSWKKKHPPQQPQEPPKGPVTPFPPIVTDRVPPRDPRHPGRPVRPLRPIDASGAPGGVIVTTTPRIPKPTTKPWGNSPKDGPVIRDHRDPRRPTWRPVRPIDASDAPGGVIVTPAPRRPKPATPWGNAQKADPVIRDHRSAGGPGGVSVGDILGGAQKNPQIRDHRDNAGPVIRDHRR